MFIMGSNMVNVLKSMLILAGSSFVNTAAGRREYFFSTISSEITRAL